MKGWSAPAPTLASAFYPPRLGEGSTGFPNFASPLGAHSFLLPQETHGVYFSAPSSLAFPQASQLPFKEKWPSLPWKPSSQGLGLPTNKRRRLWAMPKAGPLRRLRGAPPGTASPAPELGPASGSRSAGRWADSQSIEKLCLHTKGKRGLEIWEAQR